MEEEATTATATANTNTNNDTNDDVPADMVTTTMEEMGAVVHVPIQQQQQADQEEEQEQSVVNNHNYHNDETTLNDEQVQVAGVFTNHNEPLVQNLLVETATAVPIPATTMNTTTPLLLETQAQAQPQAQTQERVQTETIEETTDNNNNIINNNNEIADSSTLPNNGNDNNDYDPNTAVTTTATIAAAAAKVLPSTYYALRYGKDGLRGCIFLHYQDIQPYLTEHSEWKSFADLEAAAFYLLTGEGIMEKEEASMAADPNRNSLKKRPTTTAQDNNDDMNDENIASASSETPNKRARTAAATETATAVKKMKKRKKAVATAQSQIHPPPYHFKGKTQKANAYWNARYNELKEFQQTHNGRLEPTTQEDTKLAKFVHDQRIEYRFMMQGQESKMCPDKIHKLQAIGFQFDYQRMMQQENKEFENMLQEMKQFDREKAGDSLKRQSRALADWKHAQRIEFRCLQEGKRSTLTPERIQKLNDVGFIFVPRSTPRTLTWEQRIEQLKQYKEEHGNLNVPASHPELGYFVSNVRRGYKYLQEKKTTGFTQEKANQLLELGFSFLVGKRKTAPVEIKTWEESFQALKEFKKEHGHTVSLFLYTHRYIYIYIYIHRFFAQRYASYSSLNYPTPSHPSFIIYRSFHNNIPRWVDGSNNSDENSS